MKQITIKDVANQAGVSTTTVSHVINKTRFVSEETRKAVEQAMENLGYHPNTLARSLRSGETKTIGLILPDGANPFFADMARRIENLGFKNGYSVILCNSDNNLDKQREYINILIAKQVDGLIFISAGESKEDLIKLITSGTPFVVVDRDIPLGLADLILLDNEKAGFEATQHLIELGHKRIACITGPTDIGPSHLRKKGFQRALKQAGIPINQDYFFPGDFSLAGGVKAMEQLMTIQPQPTSIFALNDLMAIGAISAAIRKGYKIPENYSVVGFDDIELSSSLSPHLTTMAQPVNLMVETAIQRLLMKISVDPDKWKNEEIVLEAELIVRESTKPIQ